MIQLNAGRRKCVFCGEDFSLESVRWLIDKEAEQALWPKKQEQPSNATPFRDAMDRFLRDDYEGQNFFQTVSGKTADAGQPKQIRLVVPEKDLALNASSERNLNRYRLPEGAEVTIFRLGAGDEGLPCLHFTKEFISAMEASGVVQLRSRQKRRYIENTCIRPVCPHCTSYLPHELLMESPDVFVVRLALVGPIAAGKTTMTHINLAKRQFHRGAWSQDTTGIYGASHYLASNYHEEYLREKKLPTRTPKNIYIPPLLIRLERKNKQVLVVLMDVAGELLEQIKQDMESGGPPEDKVHAAQELLRQMDGYLLMLDSERELFPKLKITNGPDFAPLDVKLADLVPICRSFVGSVKKPAALVLTKCEQLFTEEVSYPLPSDLYNKIFLSSSRLEKLLWQQTEPNAGDSGYSARHHEAIQFFFKPIIQKHFRELWNQAGNIFSRIDVFPESNWGKVDVGEEELKMGAVDIDSLEPFYSAAPVFWLLDMINRSEPQEV